MAVIGTWRDDMKVDQEAWKAYVSEKGRQHTIDNIITRCPTRCMSLKDDPMLFCQGEILLSCHCLSN